MSKPVLLMTGLMPPLIEEGLRRIYECHRLAPRGRAGGIDPAAESHDALIARIGSRVEALCTGGHTGVKTDAAMLAALPELKVIANYGVGYDSIDAKAAAARGIIVTNTPDVLTEEVADTALGLLLMTVREMSKAEVYLRAGRWAKEGDYRLSPGSLRDRSVGIIGLGRIGKAIARRCEAFGLPVSYCGRRQQPGVAYTYHSDPVSLAKAVDTLIAVIPGGAETKCIVDAKVLEALGPRGVFINVARGSVVDEAALIAALRNNTILAAGLDVFVGEPDFDPAFLALENAVLLPHIGSASVLTRQRMSQLVVDNLAAYVDRTPPPTPVAETPFRSWAS
jgi:lactate dehydrogenase-like 2-hydroxyacid dehydrogenase